MLSSKVPYMLLKHITYRSIVHVYYMGYTFVRVPVIMLEMYLNRSLNALLFWPKYTFGQLWTKVILNTNELNLYSLDI